MSARSYPEPQARDVLIEGCAGLYRNPAEQPFKDEDAVTIFERWTSTDEIEHAYERIAREEAARSRRESFAWSPEFGYLSPFPDHCGAGLVIAAELHLEGLHLIGDLPLVLSGLNAVRFCAESICLDGVRDAAHLFRVSNAGSFGISETDLVKRARSIFDGVVKQELNARRVLVESNSRHFHDAIARALAILKSARLISPWELLDLISPLRLAASMGFLNRFSRGDAIEIMNKLTSRKNDEFPDNEDGDRLRDRRDARLADTINRRFACVSINAKAKEILS